MLPMGTVLDNRYRIVRYLASGGFGNTYVAEDSRLGGEVAIKEFFIRGTNHRSEDRTTVDVSNADNRELFDVQLGKFKREASRIFKLHNDHIIHVFDLFDANGTSYYVMDLVKGTSLAEQVRQQPLSETEARDVIMQVLDALKTIHANGLYHLDIKPGNIMRDTDGHCTLIDFGASKQLTAEERSTYSSSLMAYTPGYAAIEQIAQQTKNIGPWTDIYALGATFYCLLTGKRPPEVDADDTAPDGRQFSYPAGVSERSRCAISAMMNPSRRLRPQSAEEVIALLDGGSIVPQRTTSSSSMDDETLVVGPRPVPVTTGETGGSGPYHQEENKSSKKKYIVAAVVAVAVIVGGVLFWNNQSEDNEIQQFVEQAVENRGDSQGQETDTLAEAAEAAGEAAEAAADAAAEAAEAYEEEYIRPGRIVLNGVLNGDDVTFELYTSDGSNVSGDFYNKTINVSFAVAGTYTSDEMNLHSVNHGSWRFVANNYGGTFEGYASNGKVTYDMKVE